MGYLFLDLTRLGQDPLVDLTRVSILKKSIIFDLLTFLQGKFKIVKITRIYFGTFFKDLAEELLTPQAMKSLSSGQVQNSIKQSKVVQDFCSKIFTDRVNTLGESSFCAGFLDAHPSLIHALFEQPLMHNCEFKNSLQSKLLRYSTFKSCVIWILFCLVYS